jgi:hypothetical protein
MNGTYQLLAYAYDVNLLGDNMGTLIDASKKVSICYCFITRMQGKIVKCGRDGEGMQHKLWRRGMHIGCLWESQKEKVYWEDQDLGGWIILI